MYLHKSPISVDLETKLFVAKKHGKCFEEYFCLKTDEKRVRFTLRLFQEYNISPNVKNEEKNALKSTELKDKANKLYTMSPGTTLQLDSVIETYTQSVAYAPIGSRELAVAYANRSAALFTAKLYNDCLQDIERALKLDYPAKSTGKLFVRRARCLVAMKSSPAESEEALEEARQWLVKIDLNDVDRQMVEKTLNDPKQMASIDKPRKFFEDERNLPTIPNDNPKIPGASSAIELKYSEKYGRHVVATRDINPGEVIVVQRAYATIVDTDKTYTLCDNCLKRTWSGIPCNHCVDVIYCSETCRDAAWNNHHDVECQILGPLIALKIENVGLMALRLAIRAIKEAGSFKALKDKLTAIDSSSDLRTQGFTDNVFDHTKYASVYTLARNTDKRADFQLRMLSFDSTLVLYMLATRSSIFGKKLDRNTLENNEWVEFMGGLIMRNEQLAATNCRELTELDVKLDERTRGVTMVPFPSLFNHSCSPSMFEYSIGRYFTLVTTQSIKKGEQVFDCYGPEYISMTKAERQRTLREKYHFECECIACRENWPLLQDLPSATMLKLTKQAEEKLFTTWKTFKKYEAFVSAANVENKPEVFKGLTNILKVFNEHVRRPCFELALVSVPLIRAYSLLGNRWQSLN